MRAAVIPTIGREDLVDCAAAIRGQVDHIILIAHDFAEAHEIDDPMVHIIDWPEELPNISKMWNLGLDMATYLRCGRVAVLNDDAIVYPGWFAKIEAAMVVTGACAGWSQGGHEGHLLYRKAEPTMRRMNGYAFVINCEFRADEQFQWWYGDNDLEWRCRQHSGVVQVGGDIEHRHPNSTTVGRLAEIAAEDGRRFQAKWGVLP